MTLKELSIADHAERCKHTSMPKDYVPLNKYSDKNANEFNKAICRRIELFNNSFATRMSVEGRVRGGEVKRDLMGNIQISETKRLPSSNLKGSFDVTACVLSVRLECEIKVGSDRIRPDQEKFKERIDNAFGHTMIVKNWDDFDMQFNMFLKGLRSHFMKMLSILDELGL